MKIQWLALVVLLPATLNAGATRRPGPVPAPVSEKMKALAFLAGEWRGPGKLHLGPDNVLPFSIIESASFVLDGTVLQITGIASAVIDGQERIVGKGLGLVHYDAAAGAYRMRHYEANGDTFEAVVEVRDGCVAYESLDSAGVRMRVDIRIAPGGRWTERVDRFEGGRWQLFREYDLRR